MNLGESQRSFLVSHRRMNSPTDSMSRRKWWYCLASSSGMALLYPVLTGSMNTRSATSSRECSLSTRRPGTGNGSPCGPSSTRRGPKAPRWSHTEDDPGPPLKENTTGRVEVSLTPFRT